MCLFAMPRLRATYMKKSWCGGRMFETFAVAIFCKTKKFWNTFSKVKRSKLETFWALATRYSFVERGWRHVEPFQCVLIFCTATMWKKYLEKFLLPQALMFPTAKTAHYWFFEQARVAFNFQSMKSCEAYDTLVVFVTLSILAIWYY